MEMIDNENKKYVALWKWVDNQNWEREEQYEGLDEDRLE